MVLASTPTGHTFLQHSGLSAALWFWFWFLRISLMLWLRLTRNSLCSPNYPWACGNSSSLASLVLLSVLHRDISMAPQSMGISVQRRRKKCWGLAVTAPRAMLFSALSLHLANGSRQGYAEGLSLATLSSGLWQYLVNTCPLALPNGDVSL